MSKELGGGSMTFLGIADTLQGDLTGYIPSNLISMCDGQIFLSTALFGEGVRPAIDFGMSMSIVGGKAQNPLLRNLSSTLRLDYTQYSEIVRLSKLQSGVSKEAERILKKGRAIIAVLQQVQAMPVSLAEEILLLYALQEGVLTELSPEGIVKFRDGIFEFTLANDAALPSVIENSTTLTPDLEAGMRAVFRAFMALNP